MFLFCSWGCRESTDAERAGHYFKKPNNYVGRESVQSFSKALKNLDCFAPPLGTISLISNIANASAIITMATVAPAFDLCSSI